MSKYDDFLAPAVQEAAAILQHENADGEIQESDPILKACARAAYTMVCGYCNRKFHKHEVKEKYRNVEEVFTLRTTPVDEDGDITVKVNDTTLSTPDYELEDNELDVVSKAVLYDSIEEEPALRRDVRVTYTGGYTSIEDEEPLMYAVAQQTVANWNNKDVLGFTQVTGGRGSQIKTPAMGGGLLKFVQSMLHEYVYEGNAVEIKT